MVYLGILSQPEIGEAPRNTAVNGNTVKLNCRWVSSGSVHWWSHVEGGSGELISTDATALNTTKYGIENPSAGQYNLQIKSFMDSDVGDYSCLQGILRYGAHVLRVGE